MNKKQRCLECNQFIAVGATQCSCGWKVPKTEVIVKPNCGCQYYSYKKVRFCRLLGSMSHSIHANATWYCSFHYRTFGDPVKGEEMFDYIEAHYHEILESRSEWRWDLHPGDKPTLIWSVNHENQAKEISISC